MVGVGVGKEEFSGGDLVVVQQHDRHAWHQEHGETMSGVCAAAAMITVADRRRTVPEGKTLWYCHGANCC